LLTKQLGLMLMKYRIGGHLSSRIMLNMFLKVSLIWRMVQTKQSKALTLI